jgi:acyl-CoA reductase-like NAD-dependent aldehyde dehydrogenase
MATGQCAAHREGMGQYLSSFFHQPPFFGGMKMSAMGREKNRQSILEYTRQKNF